MFETVFYFILPALDSLSGPILLRPTTGALLIDSYYIPSYILYKFLKIYHP